jgi:hypothetical protein
MLFTMMETLLHQQPQEKSLSPASKADWKVAYENKLWNFKDGLSGKLFVINKDLFITSYYEDSKHTKLLKSTDGRSIWRVIFETKDLNLISFSNGEKLFLANAGFLFTLEGNLFSKLALKGLSAAIQLENPMVFGENFILKNKTTKQLFRISTSDNNFRHIKKPKVQMLIKSL